MDLAYIQQFKFEELVFEGNGVLEFKVTHPAALSGRRSLLLRIRSWASSDFFAEKVHRRAVHFHRVLRDLPTVLELRDEAILSGVGFWYEADDVRTCRFVSREGTTTGVLLFPGAGETLPRYLQAPTAANRRSTDADVAVSVFDARMRDIIYILTCVANTMVALEGRNHHHVPGPDDPLVYLNIHPTCVTVVPSSSERFGMSPSYYPDSFPVVLLGNLENVYRQSELSGLESGGGSILSFSLASDALMSKNGFRGSKLSVFQFGLFAAQLFLGKYGEGTERLTAVNNPSEDLRVDISQLLGHRFPHLCQLIVDSLNPEPSIRPHIKELEVQLSGMIGGDFLAEVHRLRRVESNVFLLNRGFEMMFLQLRKSSIRKWEKNRKKLVMDNLGRIFEQRWKDRIDSLFPGIDDDDNMNPQELGDFASIMDKIKSCIEDSESKESDGVKFSYFNSDIRILRDKYLAAEKTSIAVSSVPDVVSICGPDQRPHIMERNKNLVILRAHTILESGKEHDPSVFPSHMDLSPLNIVSMLDEDFETSLERHISVECDLLMNGIIENLSNRIQEYLNFFTEVALPLVKSAEDLRSSIADFDFLLSPAGIQGGQVFVCGQQCNSKTACSSAGKLLTAEPSDLLPEGERFIQCCGGSEFSCFLAADGSVWSVGSNTKGQLGIGTTLKANEPVKVSSLENVIQVSACGEFTLFLHRSGTVQGCGYNGYGQLGDGTTENRSTPVSVIGLCGVKMISCGVYHSLFLKTDGTVWVAGAVEYSSHNAIERHEVFAVPITGLRRCGVVYISCGYSHSCCVHEDGLVSAFGSNSFGQLGNGRNEKVGGIGSIVTVQIHDVVSVSCGGWHSMFLGRRRSTVFGCGCNEHGQLGDGSVENRNVPVPVRFSSPAAAEEGMVVQANCGGYHSLLICRDGSFFGCGSNENGQLGIGSTENSTTAVQMHCSSTGRGIGAGRRHSFFIVGEDGEEQL